MDTKWMLFGAVASFGVGVLAYVLSEEKIVGRKSPPRLRKDEVVSILKELNRESTSVLISIAGHSLDRETPPSDSEPSTTSSDEVQLTQVFAQVYRQFRVTESQFRRAYAAYKEDKEVRELAETMAGRMEGARRGVAPVTKGMIPEGLTKERVMMLIRTVYWISAGNTLEKLESLQSQGIALTPFDSRFQQAVHELERETDLLKARLFSSFGLPGPFPDSTLKLAVEVYVHDNSFLRSYTDIEEDYRCIMQKLVLQRFTPDDRQKVLARWQDAQSTLESIGK